MLLKLTPVTRLLGIQVRPVISVVAYAAPDAPTGEVGVVVVPDKADGCRRLRLEAVACHELVVPLLLDRVYQLVRLVDGEHQLPPLTCESPHTVASSAVRGSSSSSSSASELWTESKSS